MWALIGTTTQLPFSQPNLGLELYRFNHSIKRFIEMPMLTPNLDLNRGSFPRLQERNASLSPISKIRPHFQSISYRSCRAAHPWIGRTCGSPIRPCGRLTVVGSRRCIRSGLTFTLHAQRWQPHTAASIGGYRFLVQVFWFQIVESQLSSSMGVAFITATAILG